MYTNLSSRVRAIVLGFVWLLVVVLQAQAGEARQETAAIKTRSGTIPVEQLVAPVLLNADFECTEGYSPDQNNDGKEIFIPDQWNLTTIEGAPIIHSARMFYAKSCDGSAHVERMSGIDSMVVRAKDMETPPEPGKPFDIAIHQQISATIGGAYSLSGWMLSLCGGSAVPNDCPDDYYIAKMLGIDPTGGTDPLAPTVVWTENRRNFIENGKKVGWQNLRVAAVAQASTITIFARINSPFRWHGNHAFIDALSIVRSPVANLAVPPVIIGIEMTVQWDGEQSPDVEAIPKGTYQLLIDVQYRHQAATDWIDFQDGYVSAGSAPLTVNCTDTGYEFRVRARAEQPPAPPEGAWPNHRYEGVWSEPVAVTFVSQQITGVDEEFVDAPDSFHVYLPAIAYEKTCQG